MRFRVTLNNPTLGSFILTKEPKGLSDIAPTIKRGENHGLTTEIDVKLEFYCNGAGKEFIDQVRDEQGIDAEITINIEAFCGCDAAVDAPDYSIDYSDDYGSFIGGSCDEDFEEFYLGLLDLKTWSTDDIFTKVNINPAGILQTVKNRLDTKVDLFAEETLDGTALTPINEFAPYDLNLHSKVIIAKSLLTTVLEAPQYDDFIGLSPANDEMWAELPFDSLTYDELGGAIIPSAPYLSSTTSGTFPEAVYTNSSGEAITVIVDYNFIGSVIESEDNDRTYTLYLKYRNGSGGFSSSTPTTLINYGVKSPLANNPMTQAVNTNGQLIFNLADGESIYFYFEFEDYAGVVVIQPLVRMSFTTCEINFSSETTTAETTAKAFVIFEAGAQISRVITNQLDSFRSNYFGRTNSDPYEYEENGCGSFRAITNGFMIRGYPITGDQARTIRMSMNEYFRGLNAIDNLGMAIEKVGDDYFITIEPKEYFYDSSTVMLRFDNVPDLKRSEAPEYYYSRVNVGYEKWETEFTNGLDEPNSKRRYDTGIKAVDNELQLISNLVTSSYRLEEARRKQFDEFFSEDSEHDEDNYLICLNRDTTYDVPINLDVAEKRENFTIVNNAVSPETAYNLRLSPARNLLRHSNIINAGLTKSPGREIRFTSGEGNYKMTSEMDGDTCSGRWNNNLLDEGQDIQWDDADNTDNDPIWIPEILEFGYPVTFTQFKAIEANPNGVFEVSETDEDHIKAYILDFKYKPGDVSEFKLLRAFV